MGFVDAPNLFTSRVDKIFVAVGVKPTCSEPEIGMKMGSVSAPWWKRRKCFIVTVRTRNSSKKRKNALRRVACESNEVGGKAKVSKVCKLILGNFDFGNSSLHS